MIARAAIMTQRLPLRRGDGYQDPEFVPGAVKYGDLPALLALRAPHPLMILGEPVMPEVVSKAFTASGARTVVQQLVSRGK